MAPATRTSVGRSHLGLLDIGTSKVVCLILAPGTLGWRVLGLGHRRSQGIKAGVVADMELAEGAVRAAIDEAERTAGVELEQISLAVACGRLASSRFTARAQTADGIVADDDVARVWHAGRSYAERDGRALVHMNRIGWRLDAAGGISEPVGLAGRRLEADLHTVTADDAPLRNMLHLVERCHLGVAELAVTAHASALAVTGDEERRLGVTVIDMGAGTTTIAEFGAGALIGVSSLPVGGSHLTFALAAGLGAPVAEAERIKILHAGLVEARSDGRGIVGFARNERPIDSDDGTLGEIAVSGIRDIVRPKVDTILGLIAERVACGGEASALPIVLTGGASRLAGLAALAADTLGRPVRLGCPMPIAGLPGRDADPAFATVVGLLPYCVDRTDGRWAPETDTPSLFGAMGRWLRESF